MGREGAGDTGATIGPGTTSAATLREAPGPSPAQSALGAIGNLPLDINAGLNDITGIIGMIARIIPEASALIATDAGHDLRSIFDAYVSANVNVAKFISSGDIFHWKRWVGHLPSTAIFEAMLTDGLQVDVSGFDKWAKRGVITVESMLGFAFVTTIGAATINLVAKPLLGSRWGDAVSEITGQLSQELGLSWALGMIISESFQTAVGESLAEGIRKVTRPTRIDWRILRTMLRQHVIDETELRLRLADQGFPEHFIEMIVKLEDAQLAVGDIQQLYLHDQLDGAGALHKIEANGFSADDAKQLHELYISKAETAAGSELRGIARELFRKHLLTEARYREILTHTHAPAREIDDDIAAIALLHEVEDSALTVSTIHQQYLHGQQTADTAKASLMRAGQSEEQAAALIALWQAPHVQPVRTIGLSKVLSYYASGILDKSQAHMKLISLNVDPHDIDLLLEHPTAHPAVVVRRRSPGLVVQAYLADVLKESELSAALVRAGVSDDDLPYWVGVAHYRYTHRRKAPESALSLDKHEILAAWKFGIYSQSTAHNALMQLGYSADSATLLLEIEAKGPFTPEHDGEGMTVDQAIEILCGAGFTIYGSPNARLSTAQSIAESAGLEIVPPPGGIARPELCGPAEPHPH